jgi:hypothetical protein
MELMEFTSNVVCRIDIPRVYAEKDIDDIMVGAIEGGINYWGYVTPATKKGKPSDEATSQWCTKLLLEGGTVYIGDVEDKDELFQLTLEGLIKGIEINHRERARSNPDQYDAEDYDCIIQYALFGRLVYG